MQWSWINGLIAAQMGTYIIRSNLGIEFVVGKVWQHNGTYQDLAVVGLGVMLSHYTLA